jgi:hypothetical protein
MGFFGDAVQPETCTQFTGCGENAHVSVLGTQTSDQVCGCNEGMFNAGGRTAHSRLSCAPWTLCGKGAGHSGDGSDVADMTCTCLPGYYNQSNPALGLICTKWTDCVAEDPHSESKISGTQTADVECACHPGYTHPSPGTTCEAQFEFTTISSADREAVSALAVLVAVVVLVLWI